MSFKLKSVTSASLAAAFLAPVAMPAMAITFATVNPAPTTASTTLYGGGATLPAIAYVGKSWIENCTTTPCTALSPAHRLSASADVDSLFGAFTADNAIPQVISAVALAPQPTNPPAVEAGKGYAVGDILELSGGVGGGATTISVDTINSKGGVATFHLVSSAEYTTLPPPSTSGDGVATIDTTVGAAGKNARFTYTSGPVSSSYAFPLVSYCQTGSGAGRKMLIGDDTFTPPGGTATPSDASFQCGDFGTSLGSGGVASASLNEGFGAPSGMTYPSFAASDVPLSASDLNTYEQNIPLVNKTTELVQYPSVAASIAIGFQNSHAPSKFQLSEQQICGIFAGTITNWNQLSSALPPEAITVVYRSDGSGTSFNFSNHLANVCPGALGPNGAAPTSAGPSFSINQTFYGQGTPGTANAAAPAGSKGASGNGGVVAALQSTPGAIGYVETVDATTRESLAGGAIEVANVSLALGSNPNSSSGCDVTLKPGTTGACAAYLSLSPLTNFKTSFTLPASSLLYDTVLLTDSKGNLASPATAPIGNTGTGSNATVAPTQAGCITAVNPTSYATPTLTLASDYPTYPIVAVTYLMTYNTGNGADAFNLQALISEPYLPTASADLTNDNNRSSVTTVGVSKAAFAYLSGITPTKPKSIPGNPSATPPTFATTIPAISQCIKS
jgi:ABC-type phosphate transport system substrate-binding protein